MNHDLIPVLLSERSFECLVCDFKTEDKYLMIPHFYEAHPSEWKRVVIPKIKEIRNRLTYLI